MDSKLFEGEIRPFLHLMISGCIPQLFLWWCPWYAGPSTPGDGHHDGGDHDFGDDDFGDDDDDYDDEDLVEREDDK